MSVFVVILICFFKQNRYDLLWIWTRALHFENDAWWNILFSDKTKGFAFLIEYLCKRAYNNGGMGRGGGWIGLCYIEICIKIKSPQWGKNTILGCNHLLQHTRQEKLLNSLIMFDDWIISLVSHCRRLDLITRTWSLITFCFSFTIVKGAAWVLLSERWLQRSCFFFFFAAYSICMTISRPLTPLVWLNCGSSLWWRFALHCPSIMFFASPTLPGLKLIDLSFSRVFPQLFLILIVLCLVMQHITTNVRRERANLGLK